MTPDQFRQWRERMGLNRSQAAEALGLSKNQPKAIEDGKTRVSLTVALACAAIARDIRPWPQ